MIKPVKLTEDQARKIAVHCDRLGITFSHLVKELCRRNILSHRHYDLSMELGRTRKPRRKADG